MQNDADDWDDDTIDTDLADDGEPVTVLKMGSLEESGEEAPLIRVHSACMTGDVFGSLRCDCGQQLDYSLKLIGSKERGAVIYLPQEGRGIGLAKKIVRIIPKRANGIVRRRIRDIAHRNMPLVKFTRRVRASERITTAPLNGTGWPQISHVWRKRSSPLGISILMVVVCRRVMARQSNGIRKQPNKAIPLLNTFWGSCIKKGGASIRI